MNNKLVQIALKTCRIIESNDLVIDHCEIGSRERLSYIERGTAYRQVLTVIETEIGDNPYYEKEKEYILNPQKTLVYSADKWNEKMI